MKFYLSCFSSLFFYSCKVRGTKSNFNILVQWNKKREFLNIIIRYSLIFLVLQFLMNVFLIPFTQDKVRSFIRQSNVDFLPSLVKPKKFMDTVEKLTIYVDKKNDQDQFVNIVIKDTYNTNDSRIIYAKTGFFSQFDDQNF